MLANPTDLRAEYSSLPTSPNAVKSSAQTMVERPRSKAGAAMIIGVWALGLGALFWWVFTR